jgi:hypothetical protein
VYKNPRQYATSHIRILKSFVTINVGKTEYNFRIREGNYDNFNLSQERDYRLTFDGYNLSNAKALLVPKGFNKLKLTTISFDNDTSKVNPKIGESTQKPLRIKGLPLDVIHSERNVLIVKLPKIDYSGNFDIILYDTIDYDTLSDAEGFILHATN